MDKVNVAQENEVTENSNILINADGLFIAIKVIDRF